MASNGTQSTSALQDSSSPSAAPSPSSASEQASPSSAASPSASPVPTESSAPSPSAPPSPSSEPANTPSASPTPTPSAAPSSSPDTEPSSSAVPPSSDPLPPSSAPVSIPSSNSPTPEPSAPASSAPPPSSDTPAPSSNTPDATSVVTASSREPSTQIVTSLVTPSPTVPGETPTPSIIVITSVITDSNDPSETSNGNSRTVATTATGTAAPGLPDVDSESSGSGLSTGGKTAIAVVVPVVVVALLALAGILLWRRRKQKKSAEEDRRKEVEEYGYNPNNDPTLPAVGMQSEMAEDQSGYRGWGNTATSSNRKASTTLTSGMTYSDSNSNPGGYAPGSPTDARYSDGHSGDPLMNGRRETLDSEGIGALGHAPNASHNQSGVHRGPSNASSSYSAANRSDNSGDYPLPNNQQEYYDNGYYQGSPYGNDGYGGAGGQPIIRDVSARRNTRIENPSVFPQQGNSGIAQNF